MADYTGQGGRTVSGSALTRRTGTTAADRVAINTTCVFNNTGAGTHVVTFTNTGTYTGLTVGNRALTVVAGGGGVITVDPAWDGDGVGFVSVGIDGATPAEVQ